MNFSSGSSSGYSQAPTNGNLVMPGRMTKRRDELTLRVIREELLARFHQAKEQAAEASEGAGRSVMLQRWWERLAGPSELVAHSCSVQCMYSYWKIRECNC